jgi:hypothetical protein
LDEYASHFSPKYFLLCHAIELALKAYILAEGGTEKETKQLGSRFRQGVGVRHCPWASWKP